MKHFLKNFIEKKRKDRCSLPLSALTTTLRHAFRHFRLFLKWLAAAAVLGVICGLAGTLFHFLIDTAAGLFGRFGVLLGRLHGGFALLLGVFSASGYRLKEQAGERRHLEFIMVICDIETFAASPSRCIMQSTS